MLYVGGLAEEVDQKVLQAVRHLLIELVINLFN